MDIVKKLNDKGVFLIKGEVSRVAEYLKVSDATVYRYLNKIK
jgi:predicted transcriptional regulator YheO